MSDRERGESITRVYLEHDRQRELVMETLWRLRTGTMATAEIVAEDGCWVVSWVPISSAFSLDAVPAPTIGITTAVK